MSTNAQENANPSAYNDPSGAFQQRLHSSGAMGFIEAVYTTLQRLGRPYFFGSACPEHFLADVEHPDVNEFTNLYTGRYSDIDAPKSFLNSPHAIIHSYEQVPAQLRARDTNKSEGGAGRQTVPTEALYHGRPLPESMPKAPKFDTARAYGGQGEPPLWQDKAQIPDIIKPYVDEDTTMLVRKWRYDVFVKFALIATTDTFLEQMAHDLRLILKTFHHRSETGASQLHGWEWGDKPGLPSELDGRVYPQYPARTIEWRLLQQQAVAMPAGLVDDIRFDLFGEGGI